MSEKRKIIDSKVTYGKDDIIVETGKPEKKKIKNTGKKKKVKKIILIIVAVLVALLIAFYLLFAFADFYPFKQLREIYVETAMTTDEHQWLAEWFLPKSVIEKVMERQVKTFDDVNEADVTIDDEADDVLGQKKLKVGDLDYTGREILINDIEQGIMVSKVVGEGYVGKIMLVDDPSRIFLGVTPKWGSMGVVMTEMMANYDAIAGINASGFRDPNGHGDGGSADSRNRSEGVDRGSYRYDRATIGFNEDNKLVVGDIPANEWDDYKLTDCCQFGPALVIEGEQMVFDSAGYGLHPRSVIGQRADGVVLLMIIDGRQVGYSLGITLGECAKIMVEYKAVSAAANDGGSSAVLGYNGEIITIPSSSSLRSTGRYLPDAWLVRKK
ncbi:MAG: phosphodiester glycosidase family protein [Clostridiales bacterium]|nr:phosphodiester glycosidase family protein [Clostridiales bacterium]